MPICPHKKELHKFLREHHSQMREQSNSHRKEQSRNLMEHRKNRMEHCKTRHLLHFPDFSSPSAPCPRRKEFSFSYNCSHFHCFPRHRPLFPPFPPFPLLIQRKEGDQRAQGRKVGVGARR